MQIKSYKNKKIRIFDIDGEIRVGDSTPELERAYIDLDHKTIFKLTIKVED